MNATLLFDFLLCGCIIADFYFGGKRGWGLNVRLSRQRCAGRRGGKAEFLCGLMGRGWAEALRCRLGVCRIVVEFLDGFCVIFSLVHGMVGISYKIFCLYGHSWSFGF